MILNFTKTMRINGKSKPTNFDKKITDGVKLHTIRFDEYNRWEAGKKIHFSTGARTKYYNCFREGRCTSTQKIKANYLQKTIFVDDRQLDDSEIMELAINDGFDSTDDFWAWFHYDFSGKIIHWTNLIY